MKLWICATEENGIGCRFEELMEMVQFCFSSVSVFKADSQLMFLSANKPTDGEKVKVLFLTKCATKTRLEGNTCR